MRNLRRLALALLLCLCPGFSATARARSAQALPGVNVAALAASSERLYVGGFDQGLFIVEPDGQAHAFQDPSLSTHINALAWSEPEQVLWVGTARGLVRCSMRLPARCRRIGVSGAVHALLLSDSGELIAGGDAGLLFVTVEATGVFGRKQGAPFGSVWALAAREGSLFVGSTSGLFWGKVADFVRGGVLGRASLVQGTLPDDWVTALLSQGETLYVGTYNAGLESFRIQPEQISPEASDRRPGYVNAAGIIALTGGELAIASMDGLFLGPLAHTQLRATRSRDVTAVARANGGGYWVGTRQGLEWFPSLSAER